MGKLVKSLGLGPRVLGVRVPLPAPIYSCNAVHSFLIAILFKETHMSHIPYYSEHEEPTITDAINKLEQAIVAYSTYVLGGTATFENNLSPVDRISNVTHFLESLI